MENTVLENKRVCYSCGSDKTYTVTTRGYTYEKWYYNRDKDDNVICGKCSRRIYSVAHAHQIGKPYKPDNVIKSCTVCGAARSRSIWYLEKSIKIYGTILCIPCRKKAYKQRRFEYFCKLDKERKLELKDHYNELKMRWRLRMKEGIFAILGQRCVRCGFTDYRTLQIDHINGGGRKECRLHGNSHLMFKYYIKHPNEAKQKLQVLCANCNIIKLHDKKEYLLR